MDLEIVPECEVDDVPPETPAADGAPSYEFDTTYYTDGDMLETRHVGVDLIKPMKPST